MIDIGHLSESRLLCNCPTIVRDVITLDRMGNTIAFFFGIKIRVNGVSGCRNLASPLNKLGDDTALSTRECGMWIMTYPVVVNDT